MAKVPARAAVVLLVALALLLAGPQEADAQGGYGYSTQAQEAGAQGQGGYGYSTQASSDSDNRYNGISCKALGNCDKNYAGRPMGQANKYSRGCSAINRCRGE